MARPPIVDLQAFPSLAATAALPWPSNAMTPELALAAAGLSRLARATGGPDRIEDLPAGLDHLLQTADGAGVDTVAVGAAALASPDGELRLSTNQTVLDALQTNPARVLAFPEADPRRGAAILEELDRWCATPGIVGCTLMPRRWGRLALDDRHLLFPIYERCQSTGRAVLVQGGFSFPDAHAHHRPDELARVALAFPNLKLLVAEVASTVNDVLANVAGFFPNVHVVLSGWLSLLLRESPALAWVELERLRVRVGAERLLWGSGWPFARNVRETVQSLLRGAAPGPLREAGLRGFTELERRQILGGNAAALFGLPAVEDAPAADGPYNGRITWTPEAEALLKQVPGIFRAKGRSAVEDYARERGERTITVELMSEVRRALLGF